MAQNKTLFSVTAEFITSLKRWGQKKKETDTVISCVEMYRGRRLSSVLNPCGVAAALEVTGAPTDQRVPKPSHWGNIVQVLRQLTLPVPDYVLENIVSELGNIVQVETLKSIVIRIENIQKEMHDRTGESTTFYNVVANIRDKNGNILIRTMYNIVIEGADEVFIFLVRSGKSDITDIEKEYYVSMLSGLQQYPDKQVTVGMIISIKETQDMVIPTYWSASEELLHIPKSKEERDDWYDSKFYSFLYAAHKSYPKAPRSDLSVTGKPVVGKHCFSCAYHDFCEMYILNQGKPKGETDHGNKHKDEAEET